MASLRRVSSRHVCAPLVALALLVGCAGEGSPLELTLLDLDGRAVEPFGIESSATVFLFTRTDCPISNRYAPEVRRLFEKFTPRGIAFRLVYLDPDQPSEEIRAHLTEYSYPIEALRDAEHALVGLTGARVTPEAAVFVPGGRMVYRGRIDDRYVDFGKARAEPAQRDLEQALEAVLDGRPVAETTTDAVGCYIEDLK